MVTLARSFWVPLGVLLLGLGMIGTVVAPLPAQEKGKGKQGKNSNQGKGEKKKNGGQGGPEHQFSGPAPEHPFDVILGRPTDKEVTVSVLSFQDRAVSIEWGTKPETWERKTEVRSLKAGQPECFVLDRLEPDTRYVYRLMTRTGNDGAFQPDAVRSFSTQRKPGSPFVFTMQADSHLDQATRVAVYEKTLANALASRPDFHIDLGDTFMNDKYPDYKKALPQYLAQRYYLGQLAHSVPLFLVLGNHDGERLDSFDGTAQCMSSWSCMTRKTYFPNPFPNRFYTSSAKELKPIGALESHYAWQWGDALFLALDPFWYTSRRVRGLKDANWGRTLGEDQYRWLGKTLAQSQAKYKFVFIHHLVGGLDGSARGGSEAAQLYEWGGKGPDGKDAFSQNRPGWEMPIHQLLVKHKVSAVFHGHDHFFAAQELDGVGYILVPQPGHAGSDRLRNAENYGYLRGDFLPPAGHIRVSVGPEAAIMEYVRTYLPQNESAQKKNGDISYRLTFRPHGGSVRASIKPPETP